MSRAGKLLEIIREQKIVYTYDEQKAIEAKIQKALEKEVPFVSVSKGALDTEKEYSILIRISLHDKNEWPSGSYQNSFFSMFMFYPNGMLEQFAKSYKIPLKFRKSTVKTVDIAIKKIVDYIKKIKK